MTRLFLTLSLCLALSAVAEARQTLSSDEVFDKSMMELRATMEKARSSNEAFRKQNHLLRKEAERLEQEVMDRDDQKTVDLTDPLVFNNDAVLAEKEKALYEARIKNLSARLARFQGDKKHLQKKIKYYDDDNKNAQTETARLKKEIDGIQIPLRKETPAASVRDDPGSDNVTRESSDREIRIKEFQRRLDLQRKVFRENSNEKNKWEVAYSQLSSEWTSGQESLARMKDEQRLVSHEANTVNTKPMGNEDNLRQAIADLREYCFELTKGLNELKQAALAVKPISKSELQNILKKFQDEQLLLREELALSKRGPTAKTPKSIKNAKSNAVLLARKRSLSAERSSLKSQIAQAQKVYEKKASPVISSGKSDPVLKTKIAQSTARIKDLQTKITALRSRASPYQRSENLAEQVQVLEKQLQVLRNKPQVSEKEEMSSNPDLAALQKEIDQLQSRRDILADSVVTIQSKYPLGDISPKDVADKEAQLKEYWDTLKLENAALQEKLLTLQMRKDKKSE